MSNTDGEGKIESLTLENERLKQAYKYIHASRNNVDKELNEAQQELASLRGQLNSQKDRCIYLFEKVSEREEVIRELIGIADRFQATITMMFPIAENQCLTNSIRGTLEKAKSLTTKDK